MSASTTRHLTILLTDIKGFTDKTSRKSRAEIMEMLERHKSIVLPILVAKGGHLVKTIGDDAFLMTFDSPTDAVLAGVEVQEALRKANEGRASDDRIDVRVAINSGEVSLADNDVFGEPVNITARIEGVADAGEVFFTEAVYLSMNKNEVPSSEVGLLQLKGIPEKVRVYKVRREIPVGVRSATHDAPQAAAGAAAAPAGPPAPAVPLLMIHCSLKRRFTALAVDLTLVLLIFGLFRPPKAPNISVASVKGSFAMDERGIRVSGPEGSVVIDDEGIRTGGSAEDRPSRRGHPSAAVLAAVWILYSLITLKRMGTTVGGRIARVKVVRADGSPIDNRDRLLRSAASALSAYCLFLGYFWALWDEDGRGWHDLIAGTRVIKS
jgi:class 3 adenylate cyclase